MEIKIDTEKDSHEQIRKAIHFLQTLIGESVQPSKPIQTNEDTGFFGMFDETDNTPIKDNVSSHNPGFAVFDDEKANDEPVSFSLDEELKRKRSNEEPEENENDEDENPDIKIIPY